MHLIIIQYKDRRRNYFTSGSELFHNVEELGMLSALKIHLLGLTDLSQQLKIVTVESKLRDKKLLEL